MFANFTSPKSRIALQVARKIASCDRALTHHLPIVYPPTNPPTHHQPILSLSAYPPSYIVHPFTNSPTIHPDSEFTSQPAFHQPTTRITAVRFLFLLLCFKAKAIHLHPEPFTTENGYLTPTFKIKRPVLKKLFMEQVQDMYKKLNN